MKPDTIIYLNNYKKVKDNIFKNCTIRIRKIFYLIILLIFNQKTKLINNFYKKSNIFPVNKNKYNSTITNCSLVKELLIKRTQPFEYESEFYFFTSIIYCKIPFSFIRFADGEEYIMRGQTFITPKDKWNWTPDYQKFRKSLIESSSICTDENNFIAIPCKNWIHFSISILSFSKCNSSKYMSYASLFYNKNYKIFKNWLLKFIHNKNRWKIILIANSNINTDISWAYKFFPIPEHVVEKWENFSISFLSKLSKEAKENNLIFFVSAGPAANIIISFLVKINKKNIYIDFGSAIEFVTKGYSTRSYSDNKTKTSSKGCETFYFNNKKIIYEI